MWSLSLQLSSNRSNCVAVSPPKAASGKEPYLENCTVHNQQLHHQEPDIHSSNTEEADVTIIEEMVIKFKRHYEEGYDMDDPMHQRWLEVNNVMFSISDSVIANFTPVPNTDMEITTSSSTLGAASNILGDVTSTSLQHHLPISKNNNAIAFRYFKTVCNPKPLGNSTTRAITTARVLIMCLDIIKEKHMKKKAAEEEKLRRKRKPAED